MITLAGLGSLRKLGIALLTAENCSELSKTQAEIKRAVLLLLSFTGLLLGYWPKLMACLYAYIDTRRNEFFVRERIGRKEKLFVVDKVKKMRASVDFRSAVTTDYARRITGLGRFWRNTKIDELPQPCDVFIGGLNFIHARQDVPGCC